MTTEVKSKTDYRTVKTCTGALAQRFEKRRSWIHCPRCIGGNMYVDTNGEFVCIQCGCSCYPDTVTKAKESPKHDPNLFHDISNALRSQKTGRIPDTDEPEIITSVSQ